MVPCQMFSVFLPISWHKFDIYIKFVGNETIINIKEILKGEFSSNFAFMLSLMIFSNNLHNLIKPVSFLNFSLPNNDYPLSILL